MFQGGVRWGVEMSSGELTDGIDLILNMFSDDGGGGIPSFFVTDCLIFLLLFPDWDVIPSSLIIS